MNTFMMSCSLGREVKFVYTNHEGKVGERRVYLENLSYGVFPFHPEPCFALTAWDRERQARRTFDLNKIDMTTWKFIESDPVHGK